MVRIGVEDVGRRGFLKGMLGAGAFVLSVRLMPVEAFAAGSPEAMGASALKGPLSPNVWLAIDTDGSVFIIAHRSEMGSGSRTAVPLIAADELDADWKRVKLVQATGDEKYGDQDTDGSHSVRGSFGAMREAGARARWMLVCGAEKEGGVPEAGGWKGCTEVVARKAGSNVGAGARALMFQALGGVAVIADNTWDAIEGKKKLKIEWNETDHKNYSSDEYRKEMEATSRKPAKVVREVGNVDAAFAKGGKVLEAEYYAPMLAHASMEPPAALVNYKDGKADVWAATQNPQGTREAVAAALGLKKEDVTVNVTLLGGGFGRKSFPDYAVEAAVLSKQTGKPVKVVWSREDDLQFGTFHSCAAMYLKAALGEDGKPVAWLQRSTFPPIASTFDPSAQVADAGEIGLGWSDLPYAIPNHRAENGAAPAHVRIGWLRSVCNVFHAFAEHSFADELAHAAGKDPREYMLSLLGPDRKIPKEELAKDYPNYDGDYAAYPIDIARFRRVVEIATEKAGWGKTKNGSGLGMGLALHRSFLTYVATVVQVEMDKDGKVKIRRVDTAVDAGTIVNPEMARQQFEGAATFSTSLAFFGEITAKNGMIQQSNFDGYQMARMNNYPRETHVHLVESDAPPAGIGEPGVPPFTPALCNAIFAATGKRYRELPLAKAGLA